MVLQTDMTDADSPALTDLAPWFRKLELVERELRGEQECNRILDEKAEKLQARVDALERVVRRFAGDN